MERGKVELFLYMKTYMKYVLKIRLINFLMCCMFVFNDVSFCVQVCGCALAQLSFGMGGRKIMVVLLVVDWWWW